jgi:hypothetical protein
MYIKVSSEVSSCKLLFIHSSMALQPFIEPWPLLQFGNLFYTDGRTLWTSDQPVARPLPTRRTTQIQNKRTHSHSCLEWDSNPRSERAKTALCHEGVWGNGCIDPYFLDLGIIWGVSGQLHAPTALSPRIEPQYPLDRRLDGP